MFKLLTRTPIKTENKKITPTPTHMHPRTCTHKTYVHTQNIREHTYVYIALSVKVNRGHIVSLLTVNGNDLLYIYIVV
jgi:hypothetical protein